MQLLDDARAINEDLVDLRHRLHRRPEIGLRLPRTQEAVLAALEGLDVQVHTGIDLTSVTVVVRGKGVVEDGAARRAVLLRADMDALPVHEEVDVAFRSTVDGVSHACGHDVHTAMLVGAARLLMRHRDELAGDVVLMFQPGEEGFDGARRMINEGVLRAAGPVVDQAFAVHVLSSTLPCGVVASRPGTLMAASDALYVTVTGKGGHAASPHLTRDPVQAICEMVTTLQTALSRSIDAFDPVVLTVGSLHAGTRRNVVPREATFEATVRTFDHGIRDQVRDVVRRVCEGVALAHRVEVSIDYREQFALTHNDSDAYALGTAVAADLFGTDRLTRLARPRTGTEDFSRVLEKVPGAMFVMGACLDGRDPETAPGNHSPQAAFEDRTIADGAALLAGMALRALPPRPALSSAPLHHIDLDGGVAVQH